MKRKILFLFILLGSFSILYAQNTTDSANSNMRGIIKVNPLQLLGGELRIEYEKPIKHNLSLEYGAGLVYFIFNVPFDHFATVGLTGEFGVGLGLRYGIKIYIDEKKNHEGFYLEPLFFTKYFYHRDSYPVTFHQITLGLQFLFGYKIPTEKHITVDLLLGVGGRIIYDIYYYRDYNGQSPYAPLSNPIIEKEKLFTPQLGFTIGYKLYKK